MASRNPRAVHHTPPRSAAATLDARAPARTGSEAPLSVELHGVSLELHTDQPDFRAYASRALMFSPPTANSAPPQIVARLDWVDAPPSRDPRHAFDVSSWDYQWDRDLYVAGGEAIWLRIDEFLDLQLKIGWSAHGLEVTGRYHFQVGKNVTWERLRRLRHHHNMGFLRARRFSTLIYYLVYHPLLWWLSRFHGWHVLHAAAISRQGKAHVLAGLPGCGKSTLAVGALAVPGFELMSDNLLLTDGQRVRACPELLLLDNDSWTRVGGAVEHLVKTGDQRVYARDEYRCDRLRLDALEPHAIHIVGRGARAESRRLEPEVAVARIEAANVLAKEVRRYRAMGYVIDLVAGTAPPDERRVLQELTSRTRCYETAISKDESLPEFASRRLLAAK